MERDISDWFWPALSVLLAILWLWTLLRQRRAATVARTSAPRREHRPADVEDALKAAYTLQEAEGGWAETSFRWQEPLPVTSPWCRRLPCLYRWGSCQSAAGHG